MKNAVHLSWVASLALVALAGCGGGGGGSPSTTESATTPTAPSAPTLSIGAGLWRDANSSSNYRYVLVEPDGQMWGITQVSAISNIGSALFAEKGQLSITAGNISGSYLDLNGKACSNLYTCRVTGLATAALFSASGSKSIPSVSQAQIPDWSFNGSPQASYSVAVNFSALVGSWSTAASIASNFDAEGFMVVSPTGSITATNIGGCGFVGSLVPVSGKGYFRLSLSSVSGSCGSGAVASQINGVVFKTDITGRPSSLHVMWHDPTLTRYFWGVGRL